MDSVCGMESPEIQIPQDFHTAFNQLLLYLCPREGTSAYEHELAQSLLNAKEDHGKLGSQESLLLLHTKYHDTEEYLQFKEALLYNQTFDLLYDSFHSGLYPATPLGLLAALDHYPFQAKNEYGHKLIHGLFLYNKYKNSSEYEMVLITLDSVLSMLEQFRILHQETRTVISLPIENDADDPTPVDEEIPQARPLEYVSSLPVFSVLNIHPDCCARLTSLLFPVSTYPDDIAKEEQNIEDAVASVTLVV